MKTKLLIFILSFLIGYCYGNDTVKIELNFAKVMGERFLKYPLLESEITDYKVIVKQDSLKLWLMESDLNQCNTVLNEFKTLSDRDKVDISKLKESEDKAIKRGKNWRTLAGVFGVISLGEGVLIYLK